MQSGRNKEYSKCNHCKYTRWGQPSIFYNLKYNTYYHDHHQHSVQAGYNHGDKQLKQYKKNMSQSTIYIHLSPRYESSSFYLVFKKIKKIIVFIIMQSSLLFMTSTLGIYLNSQVTKYIQEYFS